jgi:hypothetical protein
MTTLLSARETEVVLLLGCYRYLGRSQVETFLFEGSSIRPLSKQVITRRILTRLTARGVLATTARLIGGPGGGSSRLGYFLSPHGYKLALSLNPGLPAKRPTSGGTFLLQHALMTADVALAFRSSARSHTKHELIDWECDWQAAQRIGSSIVVPDAHVVYATADCELDALIEIDLGTEGSRFFARKISRYLDLFRGDSWRRHFPSWPVVLTVTGTANRAAALKRATEALLESQSDAKDLQRATEFAFSSLADVVGREGPTGRIWQVAGRDSPQPLIAEAHSDGHGLD